MKSQSKKQKKARRGLRKASKALNAILEDNLMDSYGGKKLNQQTNKLERANQLLTEAFNG